MSEAVLLQTPAELAHEAYLNHLLRCPGCYAPTKRHCIVGLELRTEYDARCLISICDHNERRHRLIRETWINPTRAVALRDRVIELYNRGLQGAQEVGRGVTEGSEVYSPIA